MEQVIAENVDNCSDKSEITDQNTEKDLLSEYREAVKWFERARNELRSDENNQLSFVQMCTEQAASLVAVNIFIDFQPIRLAFDLFNPSSTGYSFYPRKPRKSVQCIAQYVFRCFITVIKTTVVGKSLTRYMKQLTFLAESLEMLV